MKIPSQRTKPIGISVWAAKEVLRDAPPPFRWSHAVSARRTHNGLVRNDLVITSNNILSYDDALQVC